MAIVTHETDVLVIGAGFAGNRAALGAAAGGAKVLQTALGAGASHNIMGFSAPVVEGDSVEVIFSDVMAGSLGMSDPELTRIYAEKTAELVPDSEALGVPFKKDASGNIVPLHSLGTTYPRLVHQYQCLTGLEIQRGLNRQIRATPAITVRNNTLITDLLVENGAVRGACGIDSVSGEFLLIKCKAVVLAAGGSGRIHPFTTYPNDVTGDGMAMAWRAGLPIIDMELLQFEPCCFVTPKAIYGYCNPTTFLKMGATLTNRLGQAFVTDYSSIQKDELSRIMQTEILEGRGTPHGGIFYDVRMIPEDVVKVNHYVHYQPALDEGGIDICKQISEVAPAGHSFQGGVVVNADCSTKVAGLFVAGENMGGVHGAKRMGGDAGGAALVFGKIAGATVAKAYKQLDLCADSRLAALAEPTLALVKNALARKGDDPSAFRGGIQEMMRDKVGVIKSEQGLSSALHDLDAFEAAFGRLAATPASLRDLLSARNMLATARMMALCAKERKESRGVHFRSDYPKQDDANWADRKVVISQGKDGAMRSEVVARNAKA